MPTLRRSRYLTCFYCGRKTSTRNDGTVRHFECPSCDATNYLDENGEITDPPVEATAVGSIGAELRPALVKPEPSEASSDVFCATCLKNQRILTSSLAQYLPDDPDDPEYEERERNLYKYRKGLERQYPQVCAQCEPKVLQRLDQAGYTAKTDHLRRMIDRSRRERAPNATNGVLGLVGVLGRYLWFAGFILQGLWHVSILRELLRLHGFSLPGGMWVRGLVEALVARLFAVLPSPEALMKWSISATAASLWWNPFLVQTVRGFTKHLLGISTWYTYQAIIMLLRITALGIPSLSSQQASELPMQLAAHCFMLGFMFLISRLSLGSIRTDTTPLFAPTKKRPLATADATEQPRSNEPASMSDILDDVLAAPPSSVQDSSQSFGGASSDRYTGRYPSPTRLAQRNVWGRPTSQFPTEPSTPPNRSPTSPSEHPQSVQYEMEMDWTPTQSKHRAFNSFGSPEQALRGFGETPVEDGQQRQFWYKVPPAPTSIAQRALNPPAAARLRKPPPAAEKSAVFGTGLSKQGLASPDGGRTEVAFKEPSFFVEPSNDPRNTLSDLFGQAFSISPKQERTGRKHERPSRSGMPRIQRAGAADIALLVVSILLLIPGYTAAVPPEYSAHIAVSVCCLSLVIWARVIFDTARGFWSPKPWILTSAVGSLLGFSEVAIAARIGIRASIGNPGLFALVSQGKWFIGMLVLHQLWNGFLGPLVQHKLTASSVNPRR